MEDPPTSATLIDEGSDLGAPGLGTLGLVFDPVEVPAPDESVALGVGVSTGL